MQTGGAVSRGGNEGRTMGCRGPLQASARGTAETAEQ